MRNEMTNKLRIARRAADGRGSRGSFNLIKRNLSRMGEGGGSKRDEIDNEKIKRALTPIPSLLIDTKNSSSKPKLFESPSRLTAAVG